MTERISGTVKWYNLEKGFGFIAGEDGKDYFIHHTELRESGVVIKEKERISFTVKKSPKGDQAQSLIRIKS